MKIGVQWPKIITRSFRDCTEDNPLDFKGGMVSGFLITRASLACDFLSETSPALHPYIGVPTTGAGQMENLSWRRTEVVKMKTPSASETNRASAQPGEPREPAATMASSVWADSAYRSQTNLRVLDRGGLVPEFQRREPRGRPMPAHVRRGNATHAQVRAKVEHVFAAARSASLHLGSGRSAWRGQPPRSRSPISPTTSPV